MINAQKRNRNFYVLEVVPLDTVDRIFALLDSTTMEQQEFAALVGVSDDTASNWRRRKSGSYAKKIAKIAEVLNTTPEYLLTGQEKQPDVTDDPMWVAAKELFVQLSQREQLEYIADMAKRVGRK